MLQFVSAPVMLTVPVGTGPGPFTRILTATDWPGIEGSGKSTMMIAKGPGVRITVGVKVRVGASEIVDVLV